MTAGRAQVPVTIVTGFLGSGKTTLLSRLLRSPRLRDTAVVVNELGEVAIDHHLLSRVDERTVLLANGCVCCSLRADLADELRDLLRRRAGGEIPRFRRVVVETTGLADPAPILSTLLADPMLRHQFRPDRVITTVDALNGERQLDCQRESLKQAAVADRLVVTKTDAAEPDRVRALVARLRELNPAASVHESSFGDVDPAALLSGDVEPAPVEPPAQPSHDEGEGLVRAFSLLFDEPLDWAAFGVWLTMLLASRGEDVLRVKGLLDVGGPGPLVLNGVQHVVHPPEHLDAWPDEDRRSRIVVIGRNLDPRALEGSLAAFQAAAAA